MEAEVEKLRAENATLRAEAIKREKTLANVIDEARNWHAKYEEACANPDVATRDKMERYRQILSSINGQKNSLAAELHVFRGRWRGVKFRAGGKSIADAIGTRTNTEFANGVREGWMKVENVVKSSVVFARKQENTKRTNGHEANG